MAYLKNKDDLLCHITENASDREAFTHKWIEAPILSRVTLLMLLSSEWPFSPSVDFLFRDGAKMTAAFSAVMSLYGTI